MISVAVCSPPCEPNWTHAASRRRCTGATATGRRILDDALRQIEADGHRRVVAVTTSAYPSYSSCRQYRENLYDAVRPTKVQLDKIRHYAHHPGFVAASVTATMAAVDELAESSGGVGRARLVFVTHAVPTAMAETSGPPPRSAEGGYVDWHRVVAAEVSRQVADQRDIDSRWDLVYCSRSGPPGQPWTEPDVNDHLEALRAARVPAVVLVPIGFVSDHMEVIYDLDTEAAATAAKLGLPFARAGTAGVDPVFVAALVDLIVERSEVPPEPAGSRARRGSGDPRRPRRTLPVPAVLLSESARTGPSGPVPVGPPGSDRSETDPNRLEFWARQDVIEARTP